MRAAAIAAVVVTSGVVLITGQHQAPAASVLTAMDFGNLVGQVDCYAHIVQNGHMEKAFGKSKTGAVLTVTATEAKTRFGPLLEAAIGGGSIVITKHNTPKAVLLSMAEYEALGGSRPPDLHALSGEFDSLVARLQTPRNRKALKSAFDATPRELGRLAVANQRRRG